eukprot:TRINITY_DN7874_c0_g1_i1.p1 TRINITY_DN7874_c0_g1~~TRINITY_DN7874_c0_g1_i1.p1  ORF type:complete len:357 (-),score=62.64 TRINITY_DN7874_c0_g1_i1:285-1355(-)
MKYRGKRAFQAIEKSKVYMSKSYHFMKRIRYFLPFLVLTAFIIGFSIHNFLERGRDLVEMDMKTILLREDAFLIMELERSQILDKLQLEKPAVFGTLSDEGIGLVRTFVMIWSARSMGNNIPWAIFVPKKEDQSVKITDNARKMAEFLGAVIHVMNWNDMPENFNPGGPSWAFAWQKMSIWNFDRYGKVVLVDSDTYFQQSANEMVDFKDFTYSTGTCDKPCHEFFWEMNAGVIVFEPNKTMYEELMQYARTTESPNKYRFVEQDLLWLYYYKNKVKPSYHMSNLYNMCINWCDSKCFPGETFEDTVVISHWVCMVKPWEWPRERWSKWTCGGKYAHKWFDRLDSLAKLLKIERWK